MNDGAMRSYSTTEAIVSGPTTLLRRALACAMALSLILGLFLMSVSSHAALAYPAGVANTVTSATAADLAQDVETGVHCHCQTTIPSTPAVAVTRGGAHRIFDVAHDPERPSAAAQRQPEPPRA